MGDESANQVRKFDNWRYQMVAVENAYMLVGASEEKERENAKRGEQ